MNYGIRSIRIKGKTVTVVLKPGSMGQLCELKRRVDRIGDADFKADKSHYDFTKVTISFTEIKQTKQMFNILAGKLYADE